MRSSQKMFEEFLKSAVWMDIEEAIRDWIEGVKGDALAAPDIDEVRRCQGRAEAMQYVLGLPQSLMEAAQYEEGLKDGSGYDET